MHSVARLRALHFAPARSRSRCARAGFPGARRGATGSRSARPGRRARARAAESRDDGVGASRPRRARARRRARPRPDPSGANARADPRVRARENENHPPHPPDRALGPSLVTSRPLTRAVSPSLPRSPSAPCPLLLRHVPSPAPTISPPCAAGAVRVRVDSRRPERPPRRLHRGPRRDRRFVHPLERRRARERRRRVPRVRARVVRQRERTSCATGSRAPLKILEEGDASTSTSPSSWTDGTGTRVGPS